MPDEVNYQTHLVEYEVAQSILSSAHLPIMCFAYQRWLETLRLTDPTKVERIISGINQRNDARERADRRRRQEELAVQHRASVSDRGNEAASRGHAAAPERRGSGPDWSN